MDPYRQNGLAQGNSCTHRGDLFAQMISIMDSCKHRRQTMVAQEVGSSVPGPVKSYSVHGTRVPEHYL